MLDSNRQRLGDRCHNRTADDTDNTDNAGLLSFAGGSAFDDENEKTHLEGIVTPMGCSGKDIQAQESWHSFRREAADGVVLREGAAIDGLPAVFLSCSQEAF